MNKPQKEETFADVISEELEQEMAEVLEAEVVTAEATTAVDEVVKLEAKEGAIVQVETKIKEPEEKPKLPEVIKQQSVALDDSSYSIYLDTARFEQAQRAAKMLSCSTIVPEHYRGNTSNCLIALDMSANLQMNPLLFMQKTSIISNKMVFEGQLVISLVNKLKPFQTPIEFEYNGEPGDEDYACTAWATSKAGQRVEYLLRYSDAIKIGNAGKNKNWQNATQLMISYRAATYLVRLYAPEIMLGCYTVDEMQEGPYDNKTTAEGDNQAAELTEEMVTIDQE